MKHRATFCSIVLLVLCGYCVGESGQKMSSTEIEGQSCDDTWFVPTGKNHTCKCGHTFDGIVSCDENTKQVGIIDCYCITFDSASNTTVVGECLFNCENVTKSYYDSIYHHVPRNIASGDDNNSVCGYLNRRGRLCSQCIEDHYIPAYSYEFKCTNCSSALLRSWPIYIAVAYGPLTVFMIFILLFRVSVVSPKLHVAISMFQAIAIPFNIRSISEAATHNTFTHKVVNIVFTLLGVWNLDFFRTVLPGVCLHLTTLQVLVLDYAVAVYPMVVTVIAFIILELHNRGCRPVMFMYRPFHYFFARFRREWNLHTSLIDAFITFFILSTTKLVHVSFSILFNVTLYRPDGVVAGHYLYEDASVPYFGSEHRPYAILAILVLTLLLLLPICLLVCYPFAYCQRCRIRFKLNCSLLDEFMHNFNQYYKDGSDGTMDCRWFAAFYISCKIIIYLPLFTVLSAVTYNFLLVCLLLCVLVVLLVQPYKEKYSLYNILDPVMILIHALLMAGLTAVNCANLKQRAYNSALFVFVGILLLLPLLYLAAVALWWINKSAFCQCRPIDTQELSSSIPDRLLHSSNYEVSLN